jgi:hypothetical protein
MLIAGIAIGAITALRAQVKPPVFVIIDIAEMSDAAAFTRVAAIASPGEAASVEGRYIIRGLAPKPLDGSAPPSRFAVLRR